MDWPWQTNRCVTFVTLWGHPTGTFSVWGCHFTRVCHKRRGDFIDLRSGVRTWTSPFLWGWANRDKAERELPKYGMALITHVKQKESYAELPHLVWLCPCKQLMLCFVTYPRKSEHTLGLPWMCLFKFAWYLFYGSIFLVYKVKRTKSRLPISVLLDLK